MVYGETPELIWSLSCKLRGEFCRRGAVMHYREARLGMLPEADESYRKINRLHRIIPESKYIRQLLLHTMREIFYRGNENDPDSLYFLALEKMESDFRKMIFGNAPLMLTALAENSCSVDALRRRVRENLWAKCAKLQENAWCDLLSVPVAQRRFIASPLKLYINELCCYASPLLAYSDRGRLRIVELRENDISAFPEVLLMHRCYALNLYGRMPETVISCQLDTADGKMRELANDFSISSTLREMSAAAARHRDAMQLPLPEIPGNKSNCGHCVFASYCETVN